VDLISSSSFDPSKGIIRAGSAFPPTFSSPTIHISTGEYFATAFEHVADLMDDLNEFLSVCIA